MSNVIKGEIKGDLLLLTIDMSATPFVSNSEAAKAAKEGREPQAKMVATTGGFTSFGKVKVSVNAMI